MKRIINIDDINIPKPSNEEVKKYIGEWDKNTEYFERRKHLINYS